MSEPKYTLIISHAELLVLSNALQESIKRQPGVNGQFVATLKALEQLVHNAEAIPAVPATPEVPDNLTAWIEEISDFGNLLGLQGRFLVEFGWRQMREALEHKTTTLWLRGNRRVPVSDAELEQIISALGHWHNCRTSLARDYNKPELDLMMTHTLAVTARLMALTPVPAEEPAQSEEDLAAQLRKTLQRAEDVFLTKEPWWTVEVRQSSPHAGYWVAFGPVSAVPQETRWGLLFRWIGATDLACPTKPLPEWTTEEMLLAVALLGELEEKLRKRQTERVDRLRTGIELTEAFIEARGGKG